MHGVSIARARHGILLCATTARRSRHPLSPWATVWPRSTPPRSRASPRGADRSRGSTPRRSRGWRPRPPASRRSPAPCRRRRLRLRHQQHGQAPPWTATTPGHVGAHRLDVSSTSTSVIHLQRPTNVSISARHCSPRVSSRSSSAMPASSSGAGHPLGVQRRRHGEDAPRSATSSPWRPSPPPWLAQILEQEQRNSASTAQATAPPSCVVHRRPGARRSPPPRSNTPAAAHLGGNVVVGDLAFSRRRSRRSPLIHVRCKRSGPGQARHVAGRHRLQHCGDDPRRTGCWSSAIRAWLVATRLRIGRILAARAAAPAGATAPRRAIDASSAALYLIGHLPLASAKVQRDRVCDRHRGRCASRPGAGGYNTAAAAWRRRLVTLSRCVHSSRTTSVGTPRRMKRGTGLQKR